MKNFQPPPFVRSVEAKGKTSHISAHRNSIQLGALLTEAEGILTRGTHSFPSFYTYESEASLRLHPSPGTEPYPHCALRPLRTVKKMCF